MAKKKIVTPDPKPLLYTQNLEDSENYNLNLISESVFNDVASKLRSNPEACEILRTYRVVGNGKLEEASSSYRYKGCKIKIQEPYLWNVHDDPCIEIIPPKGIKLEGILEELRLDKPRHS